MCILMFLGTNEPAPLIQRDPKRPGFHVLGLSQSDIGARQRIQKPFVYYLGSHLHQGCGCGFLDGNDAQVRLTRSALYSYLKTVVSSCGDAQIYTCGSGDFDSEPEWYTTIKLNSFHPRDFDFAERELFTVTL